MAKPYSMDLRGTFGRVRYPGLRRDRVCAWWRMRWAPRGERLKAKAPFILVNPASYRRAPTPTHVMPGLDPGIQPLTG